MKPPTAIIRNLALALTLSAAFIGFVPTLQAQQTPAKPAETKPAPKPPEPKVLAHPALWTIKGPHTTLYLFGTVHLMKPNVVWNTAKVASAVSASQTLLEELADADKAESMPGPETAALIKQLGTDPEHPLSTKITKEDVALLETAMKQMGAPGESVLEPLRPWLAGLTVEVLPIMKAGYDPKSGVDIVLAGDFRDKNKPVQGLETIEQQLHFLADMSEAQEIESLHIQLKDLGHATTDLEKTMAAWEKGDDETIASIENDGIVKEDPALYQRLVVQRNKTWAEKLAQLLQNDGPDTTTFVAVGAAHLAGPDSVLKMLQAKGFTVTRL
jgi:uncharacterized protein YbaP (TraB family)